MDLAVQRPFPCEFPNCPYRASTRTILDLHVQNRHNPNRTKDFPCSFCGKLFYREKYVRQHVRNIHSKEKISICPERGDKFMRKADKGSYVKSHYWELGKSNLVPAGQALQMHVQQMQRLVLSGSTTVRVPIS